MLLLAGLKITTSVENDNTVLTLHGRITIEAGNEELRDAIRSLLEQGVRHIVVDSRHVTKIDSSGIGELAAAYRIVTNGGGTLELRNLPTKIRDVLSITKLLDNFPDFPDFPTGLAF